MPIILLDESFYDEDCYFTNKEYLTGLLDFISNYIDANIAIFLPNAYIGNIWSNNNIISFIQREIQKHGCFEIYDAHDVTPTYDDELEGFSSSYIGEIHYIHNGFETVIIPLIPKKHKNDIKKMSTYIDIINHYNEELNSNFSSWVSEDIYVKNIKIPTSDKPLPNTELCLKYKSVLDDKIRGMNISERKAVYLEIGREVLQRNGYKYDLNLSSINKSKEKIREIYVNDKGNEVIIASIDVENGSFEICDKNGHHIDEFGYDNKPHSKKDTNGKHDIKIHN